MLTKNQFLNLLKAYKEDMKKHDELADSIKNKYCIDSYVIIKDSASQVAILDFLKESMDATEENDPISWYLFEDLEHLITDKIDGQEYHYHIDTDEDLYYWLTAGRHMDDDGLSYLCEYIKDIPDKVILPKEKRYEYIANNVENLIGLYTLHGKSYKDDNIRTLLKYLLEELKKA